jgi:Xaa-Pro aminopeptidase
MIDIGCKLDGYNSDLTRMFFLGKMSGSIKKIYGIVHHAQARAIALIRPGSRIADIDRAARSFIEEQGYGKYFGHALGHGVGLKVHEQPTISKSNKDKLQPGMVFTVEPAIYIPGVGGVRIEDMVAVTEDGCEVLTRQ